MSWYTGLEHIVREGEVLAAYSWLRIGGPAQYFAEPTNKDELAEIVRRCRQHELPVRILGGGSNLLIADQGVRGTVIYLNAPAFGEISVQGTSLKAGGGAKLGHVVATAAREGLSGLSAFVGIPGSVGGALRGNCSGHGAAIGQWTEHVSMMTHEGTIRTRQRDDLRFGHGESNLDELVILEAVFRLEKQSPAEVTRQMQKLWILKRASQPTGENGCGRIFADERGWIASELIEQAGLKTASEGGAWISELNANYVEVRSGATCQDVLRLIERVRSSVSENLGIELDCDLDVWLD